MIIFKKIAYAEKYHDDNAIPDVVSYILQPGKTPSHIIGGYGIDMNNVAESMIAVSKKFNKYSRIRLHHFIVSFGPKDLRDMNVLSEIAKQIAALIGTTYQIVYAIHEDTANLHVHFVFNAVSYVTGLKYRGGMADYYQLIGSIGAILRRYNLYPLIEVKYNPETASHLHE